MQALSKKHTYSDRTKTQFGAATIYLWRDPLNGWETEYYFDEIEAQRWVRFIEEFCHHVEAEWAGQKLKLKKWQRDWIRELFGWRRVSDGARRYRTAYVSMPRKNGKTIIVAAIMLGLTIIDHEPGAENFIAASSEKQAKKLFTVARKMVEANPDLKKLCTIHSAADSIVHNASGAVFRVVPNNPDVIHGANVHGACIDEYHVVRTLGMADVFDTGMGSRRQPLMIYITTAGDDIHTPCGDEYKIAKSVQEARNRGEEIDPTYFVLIFEAPEDADPGSEETWKLANPGYGDSVKPELLLRNYRRALKSPLKMKLFRQLHLNQWIEGSEEKVIDMHYWRKCKREINERELKGRPAYGGLDLARKDDLCAFAVAFPFPGGIRKATFRTWSNERRLKLAEAEGHKLYEFYLKKLIIKAGGSPNVTRTEYIRKEIVHMRDVLGFDFREIRYDPHNASELVAQLEDDGFNMVEMPQRMPYLSEPTKELLSLYMDEKLWLDNELVDWCAGNAIGHSNAAEDIMLHKTKSSDKIDPLAALVMAIGGAMLFDENEEDPYTDGLFIIG